MASAVNEKTNVFIFTWKIENFMCYVDEEIFSPPFFAHSIDSEFRLELRICELVPDESVISFYLHLERAYSQFVGLDFELSILALDGSSLISQKKRGRRLEYGKSIGFLEFMFLYDTFTDRKIEFLPQGTLTLQCKICKSGSNMSESVVCFARTRLGIEQSSFVWSIERFSALTTDLTAPYTVRVASQENPLLSMDFQFWEVSHEGEQFQMELTPENVHQITREKGEDDTGGEVGLYDFKLSFVNVSGDEKLNLEKYRLKKHEIQRLPVLITEDLLKEENGYLVDDVLSLKCQFTFYEGIVYEQLENTVYGSGPMSVNGDSRTVVLYHDGTSTRVSSQKDIQTFLYNTQLFCDVKLRAGTECFAAHKSILSAKSPVFQSMLLEENMKEESVNEESVNEENVNEENVKEENVKEDIVDVSDVDADSLRLMIHYIYTDTVNDDQLENAYKLYVAAMKYKISTLKKKCSLILAKNRRIHNACEMLLFADKHEDESLKLDVQDFILEHAKEVMGSIAWKILENRNPALAEEIHDLV